LSGGEERLWLLVVCDGSSRWRNGVVETRFDVPIRLDRIFGSCLSCSCRCPNPTDELLSCTVWVEVPIQSTEGLSCMVCGPESFGALCSLASSSVVYYSLQSS
jgi:hypothetical protein